LCGDISHQIENVNVIVSVLVRIAHCKVPSPEVSESSTNAPRLFVTSTVFDDSDVSRLASRRTVIVGLERIVSLENDDISSGIASKFTDFNELNIGELIPLSVAAGVL
jgi:hypothetical protein